MYLYVMYMCSSVHVLFGAGDRKWVSSYGARHGRSVREMFVRYTVYM